jgi:acetyl-CoA carboxylase carboxyltransferase component
LDSAGLRLEEASDALQGFGEIYQKQALGSGVIPQITAVFGNCGGGLALFPALTDFTFMEAKKAKLFINSPNALDGNTANKNNTAGADFQAKETGCVDVAADEATIISEIRQLVSLLPAHNNDEQFSECNDDLNRLLPGIEGAYDDPRAFIPQLADKGVFFETKREFAKDMVTGFIRLDGLTVGVVANSAAEGPSVLSVEGSRKAADFVNFCDAFALPILSFTNVTGFVADVASEKRIAVAVGRLTYAFANAGVPKINVITGKAFGSAYLAMNSKALGCDLVFAWTKAEIGAMEAKLAAMIISEGKGAEAIEQTTKEYAELQNSVNSAAARGYVDTIIEPAETRKQVINALALLYTKQVERPSKKHGSK